MQRFLTIIFSVFFFSNLPGNLSAEDRYSGMAVVPFDSPDPTAIEDPRNGGVYVFSTGRGIPISYSKDLLDWKRVGRVFSDSVPAWARERIPGSRGIWAPDIVYCDEKYYVYYSVSTFGSQRSVLGLAVNKSIDPNDPDYEWIDKGIVLESHPDHTDYNAIDSALFVDEDGKAYLFWGSYWTGLKAIEVDPKTGKPFEYKPGELKIPADYRAVANREGGDTSIEAPYVVRNGDWYYLFTSRGSCCDGEKSTYHLTVGRSDKPLGPYVDKDGKRMDRGGGTLLLSSTERWKGTGHNGFFRTSHGDGPTRGDWFILAAYDKEDPKRGRLTQIRPLTWNKDGWPEIGDVLTDDGRRATDD